MKTTSIIPIAVLAASSSVWADTTTSTTSAASSGSTCQAETILDACLDTTESYLSLCQSQDYSCLCDKYTAIMTCFANCPNDDRQYAIDSQKQLNCANASAFSTQTTTSKTKTASSTSTEDSSETSDAATTTVGDGGVSKTKTAASATATSSGGADAVVIGGQNGGPGLLAAFAGVVAAALL
ncbi:hypothetical protein F5Y03DRAFT_93331 [Xylaria venustula]|nr:hypothetical protein F5Y03DRAFT_93331 [Xylaria venustula]